MTYLKNLTDLNKFCNCKYFSMICSLRDNHHNQYVESPGISFIIFWNHKLDDCN